MGGLRCRLSSCGGSVALGVCGRSEFARSTQREGGGEAVQIGRVVLELSRRQDTARRFRSPAYVILGCVTSDRLDEPADVRREPNP